MIYLYLGYLSAHIYSTYSVIQSTSMPMIALVFSIAVLLIFTFIPIMGYVAARMLGAEPSFSKIQFLLLGCGVGWLENAFFYFEVIGRDQLEIVLPFATLTFFAIGFIKKLHKPEPSPAS